MKRYNFFTSRFFNAVDMELEEQPHVIMLTDVYFAEHTMIDPYTDAIQIVGRFRNGVSSITYISNIVLHWKVFLSIGCLIGTGERIGLQ